MVRTNEQILELIEEYKNKPISHLVFQIEGQEEADVLIEVFYENFFTEEEKAE